MAETAGLHPDIGQEKKSLVGCIIRSEHIHHHPPQRVSKEEGKVGMWRSSGFVLMADGQHKSIKNGVQTGTVLSSVKQGAQQSSSAGSGRRTLAFGHRSIVITLEKDPD